jgi:hypothetical protein
MDEKVLQDLERLVEDLEDDADVCVTGAQNVILYILDEDTKKQLADIIREYIEE